MAMSRSVTQGQCNMARRLHALHIFIKFRRSQTSTCGPNVYIVLNNLCWCSHSVLSSVLFCFVDFYINAPCSCLFVNSFWYTEIRTAVLDRFTEILWHIPSELNSRQFLSLSLSLSIWPDLLLESRATFITLFLTESMLIRLRTHLWPW